jgi:hypothetical protein
MIRIGCLVISRNRLNRTFPALRHEQLIFLPDADPCTGKVSAALRRGEPRAVSGPGTSWGFVLLCSHVITAARVRGRQAGGEWGSSGLCKQVASFTTEKAENHGGWGEGQNGASRETLFLPSPVTGQYPLCPMLELLQGDWPASLLFIELRQATPGDQTRRSGSAKSTCPICVLCGSKSSSSCRLKIRGAWHDVLACTGDIRSSCSRTPP